MVLKHTEFMPFIANHLPQYLPEEWQGYHFGETKWMCQVYYGNEKRIHYEVSRVWNRLGQTVEVGLHFESRDSTLNHAYLHALDHRLIEIQATLEAEIRAEVWDKGWTKIYRLLPDQPLTSDFAHQTTETLAQFMMVLEPIYRKCLL